MTDEHKHSHVLLADETEVSIYLCYECGELLVHDPADRITKVRVEQGLTSSPPESALRLR
jgi:hypothetical protein